MKISNPNLAGATMALPFSKEPVTLAADGSCDVPEKDATFLLSTPGWTAPREPKRVEPPPIPRAEETAEEESIESEALGLRSKRAAVRFAEEHDINLTQLVESGAKLAELRDAIIAHIRAPQED